MKKRRKWNEKRKSKFFFLGDNSGLLQQVFLHFYAIGGHAFHVFKSNLPVSIFQHNIIKFYT